jgi:hypothetical protein
MEGSSSTMRTLVFGAPCMSVTGWGVRGWGSTETPPVFLHVFDRVIGRFQYYWKYSVVLKSTFQ